MDDLANLLISKMISISSVESFTVGGFASSIGNISGISKVYKGSLVSYQSCIKRDVLGIDQSIIDNYGVVSSQVARLMAINGQKMFKSDVCISFTGNAGPTAMEGKPVGLVYIGIAYKDMTLIYSHYLRGQRQQIKQQAIQLGTSELFNLLNNSVIE